MPRIAPPKIANNQAWSKISSISSISNSHYCLINGDAAEALAALPKEVINTCLTSPPYWSARDYEHELQIGLEETIDLYIANLVAVFREVRRVLTPDGTAWLNLGDCYLNGCTSKSRQWERNKQLALLPYRVAIALQDDGWWVRNAVVWHKPNAMPASVRDRLANVYEPVFLLSKAEQYYFNLDAIRVPHKTDDSIERQRAENGSANGKAKGNKDLRRWLNSPRHRATIEGMREVHRRPNSPDPTKLAAYLRAAAEQKGVSIKWVAGTLNQPFERVRHYFRTDKIGSRLPPQETWENLKDLLDLGTEFDDAMAVEVGDNVFRNHPKGRNPGDVQSFALTGSSHGHFAVMPDGLARWCLKATLPLNGICLDPFMGLGTTGRVAIALGGRFVGVDVRGDYIEEAEKLLPEPQLTF